MSTKITFLGTGGGRIVVINQLRATGGFIIEMDNEMLHIDPGPGALVRAKQYGIKLRKLTGILCSHPHPDHSTDLEVVIEAMTGGTLKKRGVLIGSKNVFKGDKAFHPSVSAYHLNALERYTILKPGDKTNIGRIEIIATEARHENANGIGFVFKGEKTIGYTSDSEYFPEQRNYFKGCEYLIINCLRPRGSKWPGHMDTEDAKKLAEKVKPKMIIIQHFGIKMLSVVASEARWIQKETGIKTIAAKDGMIIELNGETKNKNLDKFL